MYICVITSNTTVLLKNLITGSLYIGSLRQNVSVVTRPSSSLQRAEYTTCKGFLWHAMGSHCVYIAVQTL